MDYLGGVLSLLPTVILRSTSLRYVKRSTKEVAYDAPQTPTSAARRYKTAELCALRLH